MTTWQWQVILALCRLVLAMTPMGSITPDQAIQDMDLLEEAIKGRNE